MRNFFINHISNQIVFTFIGYLLKNRKSYLVIHSIHIFGNELLDNNIKAYPIKAYQIFYRIPICHRLPDRTFKIRGYYFPVCSRCTGFYLGAFSYFIYVYLFYVQYTAYLTLLSFLLLLPAFLDGFTQLLNYRLSNNTLRFFTGIIGGIGLGILIKAFKWVIIMNF